MSNYYNITINRETKTYTYNEYSAKKPEADFSARKTLKKINEILENNYHKEGKSFTEITKLRSAAQNIRLKHVKHIQNAPLSKKIELFFEKLFFEKLFCKLFGLKTDSQVVNDLTDGMHRFYRSLNTVVLTPGPIPKDDPYKPTLS